MKGEASSSPPLKGPEGGGSLVGASAPASWVGVTAVAVGRFSHPTPAHVDARRPFPFTGG